MPMSQVEMERAITGLQSLMQAQVRINSDQSALITNLGQRVAALESKVSTLEATAGGARQLERLANGFNQFGAFFADLLPNHSTAPNTTRPWRPV